ncbi:MAG TPA: 3'-5' exonuclease, partial [bacterium]|nr:3'-5' exonuclease [bacterium]
DPNFSVCEPEQCLLYFNLAIDKFLKEINEKDERLKPLEAMKLKTFLDYINQLRQTHPHVFLGQPADSTFTKPIYDCFLQVQNNYQEIKSQHSVMDFNDLEIFTYNLLKYHPESLNVLYDFDESVDFMFVDEFQDTSLLQWNILKEFSEEWRSGLGAKADSSETYGLFLVGDKKQSIYFFRGAEPTVFQDVDKYYKGFVHNEYLRKNYRSFSTIISFVNSVFEGISDFPGEEKLVVCDELASFKDAFVEIKIFRGTEGEKLKIAHEKQLEYGWVADKIISLINEKFPIYDRNTKFFSPIRLKDIAIIMRKRTHLGILEEQLRNHSIPFVNVGGIGFYQEPEIIFLVSLLCALADESDDLSVNNLKNSVFNIQMEKIAEWRTLFSSEFPAAVLDKIIVELNMYSLLQQQACANVEKFLMLVHEMENLPLFEIAQNIRAISATNNEEPKADIFSERQDAVRILTAHGSKGLEFPVVFLTGIEQGISKPGKIVVMHERNHSDTSEYVFAFREKNQKDDFFNRYVKKQENEEKRILYVALTRPKQGLVITGAGNSKGVWLDMLEKFEGKYPAKEIESGLFNKMTSPSLPHTTAKTTITKKPISPISFSSQTEMFDPISEKLGTIIHIIAFEVSKQLIEPTAEKLISRARFLAEKTRIPFDIADFSQHIAGLLSKDIFPVICPQKNAYSEMPFMIEDNGQLIEGAIDRLIIEGETCRIYDIKTRKRSEITKQDRIQLGIYKKAVSSIFGCKEIEGFIIFTFQGIIKKVIISSQQKLMPEE